MDNIFNLVKKAEKNLIHGKPIKIGKYAEHDHTEKIATIDAYINSQHISGKEDSIGREKPFFSIVLTTAYTWYKTTNIDRKHIVFIPRNAKQRLKALVATLKLRKWMDKKHFGQFLNEWGWTLARYGSAISKWVEKDGKLIPSVIAWDRMICDPIDFEGNLKAEKIYYTPAQLRQQKYDPEAVEEAIEKFQESRQTIEGEKVDVKNEYIGIYEVHGELPLSLLTGKEEDETTYQQQMHVIFMQDNPKDLKKKIQVSLYSGKEKKCVYHLAHLIKEEGRTLGRGAIETLFDPQWMVNHSMKQVKDQLDLASKMVSQTSDPYFLGRNIATDVDTGSVLIHKENQPLTQVNFQSHDIPNILGILEQWKQGGKDISGVHEAVTGEQPPSGTPYRLQAMLSQQAQGLFDMMLQNKGLYLEEIIREYVLPHFKKQLKDTEEVIATLEGEELEEFDNLSLPAKLSQELMARLSSGHIPSREELMMAVEEHDNQLGSVRVLKPSHNENKTWKEYFEDLDMDAVEVEITGENRDKQAILTTLDSILQRMMMNPEALNDPNIRKVFNKIIDEVGGISPLELKGASPTQGAAGGQPQAMAGAGAVGAPTDLIS